MTSVVLNQNTVVVDSLLSTTSAPNFCPLAGFLKKLRQLKGSLSITQWKSCWRSL